VVSAANLIEESLSLVNVLVFFALYYICEEIQDYMAEGWREYFIHAGWMNLIDWVNILVAFWSFWNHMAFFSLMFGPKEGGYGTWTFSKAVAGVQASCGIFLLCLMLKGLGFTQNIPIMCSVGNTFGSVVVPISSFLVVIVVLFFAFGFVFNVLLNTYLVEFQSLPYTLFTMFRGLLGDLNIDDIIDSQPIYGRLFFVAYVTTVLFVAFTLLISIVCQSYDAVSDHEPDDGLLVSLIRKWKNYKDKLLEEPIDNVEKECNPLKSVEEPAGEKQREDVQTDDSRTEMVLV